MGASLVVIDKVRHYRYHCLPQHFGTIPDVYASCTTVWRKDCEFLFLYDPRVFHFQWLLLNHTVACRP